MKISKEQYERIADSSPRQRGNVTQDNLQVINAILYVAENGCKWRSLPREFGNWHSIYTRMSRWSKKGVLDMIFKCLQHERLISSKIEAISLDSTSVKVHPDGTGALKKTGPQSIGKSRDGWTTKIHMVAASAECALIFSLSPGHAGDAPQGRKLLEHLGPAPRPCSLLMDGGYEGNKTQRLSRSLGYDPVVLPNPNRLEPWDYDKTLYKNATKLRDYSDD